MGGTESGNIFEGAPSMEPIEGGTRRLSSLRVPKRTKTTCRERLPRALIYLSPCCQGVFSVTGANSDPPFSVVTLARVTLGVSKEISDFFGRSAFAGAMTWPGFNFA